MGRYSLSQNPEFRALVPTELMNAALHATNDAAKREITHAERKQQRY